MRGCFNAVDGVPLVPAGWFVSIRSSGVLNTGISGAQPPSGQVGDCRDRLLRAECGLADKIHCGIDNPHPLFK